MAFCILEKVFTNYFDLHLTGGSSLIETSNHIFSDASSGENVIESLVSEGLVTVRQEGIRGSTELARLAELESAAKAAGKGKWASSGLQEHIRDIKWSAENPRQLVDKFKGKPVSAVVEHVRDGSTIRAFLLPDFYHITLMVSGIRVSYYWSSIFLPCILNAIHF